MFGEPVPDLLLRYLPLLRSIMIAVVILLVGWRLSHIAQRVGLRLLSNRHIDQTLGRFGAQILRYLVLAATVITSMESVGLHTTSLVAILASAGLAVGLAMQGSLSNFASGVMLLFFRPFELGDKVKIIDNIGVVDDIGVFTTTLISASNEKIIIPNSKVTENAIINFSNRGNLKGTLTVELSIPIAEAPRAIAVLVAAAQRAGGIAKEPAPEVLVSDMEEDSVKFALGVWYRSIEELQVMHNLRLSVGDALRAAGLTIKDKAQVLVDRRSA